jgi:transcriptional regulator with XRE-family HTH domain
VPRERTPLALRGRRVVRELREYRESLRWTLDEAAQRSGLSPATISRTENGESLRAPNVSALLAAYGASRAETQRLLNLARNSRQQGWWASVDDAVMSAPYKDLAELEQEAAWKRSFEPLMIPGLLQTEDYARLAIAATVSHLTEEQQAEKLSIRLKRQERIGELQFSVITLEETLRRPVGGAEVMRAQLAKLLEVSATQRVELRAISMASGMHPGLMGAFTLLGGFPFGALVAYVETASGEGCFEDGSTVGLLQRRYESLEQVALDPARTRDLIAEVQQGL